MSEQNTKHTPGPILKEGETPLGVMLLAGPEYRETIIYLLGPERQQYALLVAAAPELRTLVLRMSAHLAAAGYSPVKSGSNPAEAWLADALAVLDKVEG